jgi:hypothetical protein
MSTKSHTHKRCGTLRKKLFSTRWYAEIHIQRPFFDNKKGIRKIVVLKIQIVRTRFGAFSTCKSFFFEKNYNLNFWWYFKIPQAYCLWANFDKIWQFWVVLDRFEQIQLLWQWLIACPCLKGRDENVITFANNVRILRVMASWKAL